MIKRLIYTVIISIILASCYVAPQSIYILEPAEDSGVWLMGQQYFHSKTETNKRELKFYIVGQIVKNILSNSNSVRLQTGNIFLLQNLI